MLRAQQPWRSEPCAKAGSWFWSVCSEARSPLSLVSLIQRAITIQASYVGTVAELKEVVALARARKLKPIPIEKRPLSEVSRTLEQLKAGAIIGRVVAEI